MSSETKQDFCLQNPHLAIHIRLDAMGDDLTKAPWWYKASKRKRDRLPIRLMGSTVSHYKQERIAFLISEYTKEVFMIPTHIP